MAKREVFKTVFLQSNNSAARTYTAPANITQAIVVNASISADRQSGAGNTLEYITINGRRFYIGGLTLYTGVALTDTVYQSVNEILKGWSLNPGESISIDSYTRNTIDEATVRLTVLEITEVADEIYRPEPYILNQPYLDRYIYPYVSTVLGGREVYAQGSQLTGLAEGEGITAVLQDGAKLRLVGTSEGKVFKSINYEAFELVDNLGGGITITCFERPYRQWEYLVGTSNGKLYYLESGSRVYDTLTEVSGYATSIANADAVVKSIRFLNSNTFATRTFIFAEDNESSPPSIIVAMSLDGNIYNEDSNFSVDAVNSDLTEGADSVTINNSLYSETFDCIYCYGAVKSGTNTNAVVLRVYDASGSENSDWGIAGYTRINLSSVNPAGVQSMFEMNNEVYILCSDGALFRSVDGINFVLISSKFHPTTEVYGGSTLKMFGPTGNYQKDIALFACNNADLLYSDSDSWYDLSTFDLPRLAGFPFENEKLEIFQSIDARDSVILAGDSNNEIASLSLREFADEILVFPNESPPEIITVSDRSVSVVQTTGLPTAVFSSVGGADYYRGSISGAVSLDTNFFVMNKGTFSGDTFPSTNIDVEVYSRNSRTGFELLKSHAELDDQTTDFDFIYSFSPDSNYIIYNKGVYRISATGELALYGETNNSVSQCVFSPDGNFAYMATNFNPVEGAVYRLSNKSLEADLTFGYPNGYLLNTKNVFSNDSRYMVVCTASENIESTKRDFSINLYRQTNTGFGSPIQTVLVGNILAVNATNDFIYNFTRVDTIFSNDGNYLITCACISGTQSEVSIYKIDHDSPTPLGNTETPLPIATYLTEPTLFSNYTGYYSSVSLHHSKVSNCVYLFSFNAGYEDTIYKLNILGNDNFSFEKIHQFTSAVHGAFLL